MRGRIGESHSKATSGIGRLPNTRFQPTWLSWSFAGLVEPACGVLSECYEPGSPGTQPQAVGRQGFQQSSVLHPYLW